MPAATPFYRYTYFTYQDELDTVISIKGETERFYMIDRQIYGIYSVFGNGVIDGWEVYDNGFSSQFGISIGISAGQGIIDTISAETFSASIIFGLSPNQLYYVYANIVDNSASTAQTAFFVSTTESSIGIKIAKIQTSEQGILSIDNSVRKNIGFKQVVIDAIFTHKHRGSPTKIDLVYETKNQLPGAKIEDLPASKIVYGKFSKDKIPRISHSDLLNAGTLSHAQLDTIAASVDSSGSHLLGNLTTANWLRQILWMKYRGLTTVDNYFFNEFIVIPGISPNSFSDFDESTATIDTTDRCIVGLPLSDLMPSHYFTRNFLLPANPVNVFITSRTSVPSGSSVEFGVSTTNSVVYSDFTTLTTDIVNPISAQGNNIKIGIEFIWGGYNPTPYADTMYDAIEFYFSNSSSSDKSFHFRIRFYEDDALTSLYYTAESRYDQDMWLIDGTDSIPSTGYYLVVGQEVLVSYFPNASIFQSNRVYYLILDVWDGTSYTSASAGHQYVSTSGGSGICDKYGYLPQVKNFAVIFDMENGAKIMLNL